jgi:Oxysterol-binding protein
MKSAGETLLKGRGIVAISLPVRIFEPRSTLERLCDMWCSGPVYLKRAGLMTDKLERFRNIVAFSISGLWNMGGQKKPFNPILGETYQAHWPDGSSIQIEHTSHHPPICNYYVRPYYFV